MLGLHQTQHAVGGIDLDGFPVVGHGRVGGDEGANDVHGGAGVVDRGPSRADAVEEVSALLAKRLGGYDLRDEHVAVTDGRLKRAERVGVFVVVFNAECLSLSGDFVLQNQGILAINANLTTTGNLIATSNPGAFWSAARITVAGLKTAQFSVPE